MLEKFQEGATRARQAATRGAAGVVNSAKATEGSFYDYATLGTTRFISDAKGYEDSGAVERISLIKKGISDEQIVQAIKSTLQKQPQPLPAQAPPPPLKKSKGGKSRRRSSRKSSKRSSEEAHVNHLNVLQVEK